MGSADAGALVLKAGRPVLILPERMPRQFASKVLVAWKDVREARRAVHDALPIVAMASEVRIVEAFEWDGDKAAAEARVGDVVAWLALHGVKASASTVVSKGDAADDIESLARGFKADLIIAGAYGHSRLGEWMFGGVTRHLLTKSERPVLLSH